MVILTKFYLDIIFFWGKSFNDWTKLLQLVVVREREGDTKNLDDGLVAGEMFMLERGEIWRGHFVWTHNHLCYAFLLSLLLLNLGLVANFDVGMLLNHLRSITSCFDGLNQSHSSYLAYSAFFSDHKPGILWSLIYYLNVIPIFL